MYCVWAKFESSADYVHIANILPGESTKSAGLRLQRKGQPITLWARDQPATSPDVNLYGSHPILYDVRKGVPFCHYLVPIVKC